MSVISGLVTGLEQLPTDRLAILLGLAALGLAAFAIYAVTSIAKSKGRR
jgi:hypothetical protein